MGEGQLDIYQGGGELPGVQEFGGGEDATAAALMGDNDGFFLEGKPGVELTTLEEVIKEGDQNSIEEATSAPITVPPIAGLIGGVAVGEVGPGDIIAELPQNCIQDEARMDGGTATNIEGTGRWLGILSIDYGLDDMPLLIGEVHGLDELSVPSGNGIN